MQWRGLGRPLAGLAILVGLVGLAVVALQGSLAAVALVDTAIVLSAALATGAAAWRMRQSPQPWPWALMTAGLALFTIAESYWAWMTVVRQAEVPAVSGADAVYYAGYASMMAALVAFFPHQATIRGRLRRLADVLVLTVVLLTIVWIAVLRDALEASGDGTLEGVVALGYPALDVAMASILFVLGREVTGRGRRRMALLAAGFLAWTAGDLSYAYQVVVSDFASGLPLDVAWFAGYLLFGLAAGTTAPQVAASPAAPQTSRATLYFVYLPVALLLPLAAFDFAEQQSMDPFLFGLGLSIVGLLALRQGLLTRDLVAGNEDLREREALLEETQAVAGVGSWEIDLRTGKQRGSVENRRLFGFLPGEPETREVILSHVHPDDRATLVAALERILQTGREAAEVRILLGDGGVRWLHVQGEARLEEGRPVRVVGYSQDVTARRLANQKLLHREALLLETQSVGRIGSWEIDLSKGIYSCSPENSRLFAIEHKPAHDPKEAMRNLHPDDVPAVQAAIEATIRDGSHEIVQRIVLPGGTLRYLQSRGELRRDDQGAPARIVGMSVDVTAQREADEALRASNERFKLAAQATRDVIWDWDLATNRFVHSDNMLAVFGHHPEALSGSLEAFTSLVHGDDARALSPLLDSLGPGGPSTFTGTYRFRHADGTYRIVLDRAHILRGTDGRAVRVVGAMQDVTSERKALDALRASEERMRSLLDNLEEVYVSSDLVHGTATSSAAIEKVFGHPRAVYDSDPMAWSRQLHPEDAPRVMGRYAELVAGTATVDETRILRPDGKVRWIRAAMRPVKDAAGKVVRIDGVLRDITAEREARQHEEEVKRLQEVTAFKTQFLNNAAHELATPLTPIKLQMASLRKSIFGELTPKQADAVGLLDRNLERLSLLVADLLDAARLQGGRLKLQAKPLPLGPIASDVVQSFEVKARQDGIGLSAAGLSRPIWVAGDGARLNQVLFNLVHNALKFTPRGGRIDVALDVEGTEAVVRVADTGLGLSPGQIARLFQPFVQVHDTAVHNVGGTGLGLYISRGIVEQHGGRMTCASAGPGQGTTFEVRLPLVAVPAAEPSPVAKAA